MRCHRAAVVGVVAVALALGTAFAARPPEAGALWRLTFVLCSLAGCGLLWWVYRWWEPSVRSLLLWSVGLRLVFLPLAPGLSDDGYRYLWDGLVQFEGESPYAHRPSDAALADVASTDTGSVLLDRMNSRDVYSVYPPVSQFAFRLAALLLPMGWLWAWYGLKLLLLLTEAVGVWALVRWAGPRSAMLYALHPVALIEVAGQGHTEGLLLGALGVTLLSLRGRRFWMGAGFALATWIKLWPLVWLPGAFRRSSRASQIIGAAAFIGLGMTFGLPQYVAHVAESLVLYAGTFDFYSAPYRLLKTALYGMIGDGAGALAASGLTGVWIAICIAAWAAANDTPHGVRQALIAVSVGYVLTTSTWHPWHGLVLIAFIPLLEVKLEVIWITGWSLATYLTYAWPWTHAAVIAIGWGGAIALWLARERGTMLRRLMHRRACRKADRLGACLNHLGPGAKILDLGAGEGFVGREIGDRFGLNVDGLDVTDFSASGGPRIEVYDGGRIPGASGDYNATLLVYVLHHASAPRRLLREAVRVTHGPVVILETVCFGPHSKRWLEGLDRVVNRFRSGGQIDEEPLDIRTDAAWMQTFADEGLTVRERTVWPGLHPKALYVLDGQAATSSTSEVDVPSASKRTASG